MDNMYNQGRNQHTIPGVLRDPSGKAVQPQPVSYETIPISEDDIQGSFISDENVQSPVLPDDHAEGSSIIPGGAITFIKARLASLPAQPQQSSSQKLRTDQVYRLLAVAVIAVLIASSVLVTFIVTGGMGSNALNHANQPLAKAQVTATARSTRGHTTTAPKPTPTPVPTQANPLATQQSTQTSPNPGGTPPPNPVQNNLTVQFVKLPQSVPFQQQAQITVQTRPGATVQFNVTYLDGISDPPMQQTAGNNGMVTFTWYVDSDTAWDIDTAKLVAIAQNNGQQAQIQTTLPVE